MTRTIPVGLLLCLVIIGTFFMPGCSTNNSTSRIEDPYPEQDISGVWLGYLGEIFAIGIITTDDYESYDARFITADGQFISVDSSPFEQAQNSAIFTGELDECFWDTTGQDYSTLYPQLLQVYTPAATRQVMGLGLPAGAYTYVDSGEVGIFAFIYNTTYNKISPNVNDIGGQWEIQDSFREGNTLVLTIAPNTATTTGTTITGQDDRGNTFSGTIEIRYSDPDSTAFNVYDVNMTLNDTIDLTGLATYVSEVHTSGINIEKTLIIGASTNGKTYAVGGLAKQR